MGAKPHSILLPLSLPTVDHDWLEGFSQESMIVDQFGVALIGGDTTQVLNYHNGHGMGWIEQGKAITCWCSKAIHDLFVVGRLV